MDSRSQPSVARCPACGGDAPPRRPATDHRARHNAVRYTLQACPACDLQFWTPLVADPSVYEGEGFEAYADYHEGRRPFPRWAEPLFALDLVPGRSLDVGCGDGAVPARLSGIGFEAHGLDQDARSIRVARDKYGLDTVQALPLQAFVAESLAAGRRFDLVTFFEVLEHQDAPREFLALVARIARPGAQIAGSVPARDRFLAGLDRRMNEGDLPPHHFLWFSPRALRSLLVAAGLVDVEVRRAGGMGYAEVMRRIGALVVRRTRPLPLPLAWPLRGLAALSAPLFALPVWLGLRRRPSHLFFLARTPEGAERA